MDGSPCYAFSDAVLERVVDGELVLLDLGREQYYGLDAVGTIMVQLLTSIHEEEAQARLRTLFDVPEDVLQADVRGLIDELIGAGLLVRTDQA